MNDRTKHVIVTILVIIILFILISIIFMRVEVWQHELVHVKICEYFNGDPVLSMDWTGLSGGVTCYGVSEEDNKIRLLADSMNESVQYQLYPLFLLVIGFAFVICLLLVALMYRIE